LGGEKGEKNLPIETLKQKRGLFGRKFVSQTGGPVGELTKKPWGFFLRVRRQLEEESSGLEGFGLVRKRERHSD